MPLLAADETVETYHDVRFTYDPDRAVVWGVLCQYLQPFVVEDEAMVELGAGYGEFSRFIRLERKWALDRNPELARYRPDDVCPRIQSALDPIPLDSGS